MSADSINEIIRLRPSSYIIFHRLSSAAAADMASLSLKEEGNAHYRSGRYLEAEDCYTRALAEPGAPPDFSLGVSGGVA